MIAAAVILIGLAGVGLAVAGRLADFERSKAAAAAIGGPAPADAPGAAGPSFAELDRLRPRPWK